jgi:hypothetical protein
VHKSWSVNGAESGARYVRKQDSFESVAKGKYLLTNLTNKNDIQKEVKNRLNSESVCYYSVHNPLSSSFISKNIKPNREI